MVPVAVVVATVAVNVTVSPYCAAEKPKGAVATRVVVDGAATIVKVPGTVAIS